MSSLVIDGVRRTPGNYKLPRLDLPVPQTVVDTPILYDVPAIKSSKRYRLLGGILSIGMISLIAFGLVLSSDKGLLRGVATAKASPVINTNPTPKLAPAAIGPGNGLQSLLNNFTSASNTPWGIVVTNLSTGETGTINSTGVMESASLYKLFIAQAVYKQIDSGKLSYSKYAGPESGMNVGDCLKAMITVSDNACGHDLGYLVGWNKINPSLAAMGMTGTDMSNPIQHTSAQDVAKLFSLLYTGQLESSDSSAQFISLLKAQRVNNRLPQGLPSGTVMAHKTGDLDSYFHDAGIVYGPKSNYLIVVMSGPWHDHTNMTS